MNLFHNIKYTMLTASFFNLCRRPSSLKSPSLTSYVSKYVHFNGTCKYSKCCTKRLFQRPVYSATFNQHHVRNFKELEIIKRYKQTSTEKSLEENLQNSEEPPEKLSIFKRYRKMLKEYWYVLVPVHVVTSAFWFGGFYYLAKCGVDIVPFLEFLNVPEKFISPLRSSSLGYIAVASAFYKIATPARYMVTLGGTTFAIKILTKRGLIKPVPTKAQLKTHLKHIQSKLKTGTDKQS